MSNLSWDDLDNDVAVTAATPEPTDNFQPTPEAFSSDATTAKIILNRVYIQNSLRLARIHNYIIV